jgi:hypothetical protein
MSSTVVTAVAQTTEAKVIITAVVTTWAVATTVATAAVRAMAQHQQ